jgi:hypothetical protein
VRACRLSDARLLAEQALALEAETDVEALATQALALALPGEAVSGDGCANILVVEGRG